jgi:hypothetical protein
MAKDKYRVIGDSVVAGKTKGEEVSLDDEQFNVEALIEGGHIKPVKTSPKQKEE